MICHYHQYHTLLMNWQRLWVFPTTCFTCNIICAIFKVLHTGCPIYNGHPNFVWYAKVVLDQSCFSKKSRLSTRQTFKWSWFSSKSIRKKVVFSIFTTGRGILAIFAKKNPSSNSDCWQLLHIIKSCLYGKKSGATLVIPPLLVLYKPNLNLTLYLRSGLDYYQIRERDYTHFTTM